MNFEKFEKHKKDLGQNPVTKIDFRQGFSLYLQRMKTKKDFSISVSRSQADLHFGFPVQGGTQGVIERGSGKNQDMRFKEGIGGILFLPDSKTTCHYPAGESIEGVALDISRDFLSDFLTDDIKSLPKGLRTIITGEKNDIFVRPIPISPASDVIIKQMLACSNTTPLSKMFLEAKSLELLFLQLSSLNETPAGSFPKTKLAQKEKKKILFAKELLVRDLTSPPRLMDLASTVGLSHTRLNFGFKEVFGMTAFAYLRDQRLNMACKLLREGMETIAQVADTVGFCDQSHLTRAFSKRFGISPAKYLGKPDF